MLLKRTASQISRSKNSDILSVSFCPGPNFSCALFRLDGRESDRAGLPLGSESHHPAGQKPRQLLTLLFRFNRKLFQDPTLQEGWGAGNPNPGSQEGCALSRACAVGPVTIKAVRTRTATTAHMCL